jgi:RNA polymerase sigma-70 factor (ECF subfamily)
MPPKPPIACDNTFMDLLTPQRLEAIIHLARTDAVAREQLLAHYRPFLRIMAEQEIGPVLRRREDPSDIVQCTLLEAAGAVPQFAGTTEPEFSAWIKQILRRNVATAVRGHHAARRDMRREQYDPNGSTASLSWHLPAARQSSPSLKLIKAEAALNLARSLEQLPDDQRAAVRMRHIDGLSFAEIEVAMDKTSAAVAGLIRRGVKRLRELLDDELS